MPIDRLEPRQLFSFVPTGASTINGVEFQSIDQTVALPGGGSVSAGIFGPDTEIGGRVYQPRGDSDVFLALNRGGKQYVVTIGTSTSQDLDTDDRRADFAADPRRVGDDFVFGVDSRIRGADEYVSQMKVGPDGKLYVALLFRETVSLNTQNPRAMTLKAADEFSGTYTDSAILRYDLTGGKLALDGTMQIGGPFNDFVYDFDFDSAGNLLVAGAYERRCDFDPTSKTKTLEPDGRGDGFVAKYTSDFKLVWVDNFGGDTGDESRPDAVYSIAVAADDSIYAGGSFARTADFDPRAGKSNRLLIKSEGNTDAFTLKLDPGGTLAWVRTQGGDGADAVKRVALAPDGGVYNVGYFTDKADLDSRDDHEQVVRTTDDRDDPTDLFFTRFASGGTQLYAKQIAGDGVELIASATAAPNGDLILAGSLFGRADFDTTKGTRLLVTPEANNRTDSNVRERDYAYSGFVAVYKSNARLRSLTQIDGQQTRSDRSEDVLLTSLTRDALTGQLGVAGRYRGGFSVPGTKLAVGTKRDFGDDREDGFTFVFRSDLTPIA